ncbi:HlyD family efflux transporter periplasmic adaptor subunit [Hymenobacter sp. 15J16-1T3B]|uniref:HlyD family efflux transporter periplasmic adaptor subunit n=1 Tax=Hymenobacter sp. 15J16-1T3B TaxID=2886941 RepID=UPI001D1043C1|nr:HlyD family efflux transporter periplasmic adaptor subunit [Hymenobacter sp. 15J16-1T3B]MCC3158690.1 HlyD family efflux transporter periplasmic adaptor subunit [Hymenobacter sp. 15J16-1T3B]
MQKPKVQAVGGPAVVVNGALRAARTYPLLNPQAGWVRLSYISSGQFVTRGQLLLKLDLVPATGAKTTSLSPGFVKAPAPGLLTHVPVQLGPYLGRGAPVATLHDWSRVRATFRLSPALARPLAAGQRWPLLVPELPGRTWVGEVEPLPSLAREALVSLLLDNPGAEPAIRPGMHVRLRLPAPAAQVASSKPR